MISPRLFVDSLVQAGCGDIFIGVPDSLLKEFSDHIASTLPKDRHIIAANEGTAVGMAAGFHLATNDVPLVYLQNSGLGNAINPLLSLSDPEVYGIPMVLLIGWRGEPSVPDEPQHIKQGRITPSLLDAMEIPFYVLDSDNVDALSIPSQAVKTARSRSGPVAILARKNVFSKAESRPLNDSPEGVMLVRESAIKLILDNLSNTATVISTTGHISRELYEFRVRSNQNRDSDFLTVGCMGHASQIALGVALSKPNNIVVCLDGDGAALMHMGALASIGTSGAKNFVHVVLNNGAHDSVGGQPTVGFDISLNGIATACGYKAVRGPLTTANEIVDVFKEVAGLEGPSFVEVWVGRGARSDLGRPKESPSQNKMNFVDRLRSL